MNSKRMVSLYQQIKRMPTISVILEYLLVIGNVGYFCFIVIKYGSATKEKCMSNWACRRHMRPSGLGYDIDTADGQWRDFRGSLILLACALVGCRLLLSIVEHYFGLFTTKSSTVNNRGIPARSVFHLLFGCVLLFVQHKWQAIITLSILVASYYLGRITRNTTYRLPLSWCFAVLVLFVKESYRLKHKSYYWIFEILFDQKYAGIYSWHLPMNFVVLRMISFHADDAWAVQDVIATKKQSDFNTESVKKPLVSDAISDNADSKESIFDADEEMLRSIKTHRSDSEYCLINYMSYCLYAPLYMAGPIQTFNSYMQYTYHPQNTVVCWKYALRWVFCLILLEVGLHYFPIFALISSGLFWTLSPLQLACCSYIVLKLMWLKFLVIWRFFRLWALVDGKNPPENMTRCMSNNSSLEKFWKGWHSSFNKWLVRYMYLPLGGRSNRWLTVWPIFIFVAIWHDIELKLLVWGGLNAVFLVIETSAKSIYNSASVRSLRIPTIIRDCIEISCATTYIFVLVGINLIGYGVGLSGVQGMYTSLANSSRQNTSEIVSVICGSFIILALGVRFMRILVRDELSRD